MRYLAVALLVACDDAPAREMAADVATDINAPDASALVADPRVGPGSFTFSNATPTAPEVFELRVFNGPLATTSFRVLAVRLATPSDAYRITTAPEPGTEVGPDVIVRVEYRPIDGSDTNTLIIETDVDVTLRVTLAPGTTRGSYSMTYADPDALDFAGVTSVTTRALTLTSDGPGPITVRPPRLDPSDRGFTFATFIDDQALTRWPRALAAGKSVRFEVTYDPSGAGDATLVIPIATPEPADITIPLTR